MRRLLFVIIALLGIALQSRAQITFEFPKFTKLLQVQTKGINVRAEPSTQSAKVANGPEMLLVIDETDEWYHACIVKNGRILSIPGYVSKKVCRVKEPRTITSDYAKHAYSEHSLKVINKTSGKYRGWTTISFRYFSLGWESQYFFIGKPVANSFVGKLFSYNSVDNEVLFYPEGVLGGPVLRVPSNSLGGEYNEDLNKLTDNDLDKLMSSGDKNTYSILYADKVNFEYSSGAMDPTTTESGDGVQSIMFNTADFQGEFVRY